MDMPTYSNPVWYRGFRVYYDRAPFVTGHDWAYQHDDYDGDEDNRAGTEADLQACKDAIDERFFDDEPEGKS